jgi:hypothetical protein
MDMVLSAAARIPDEENVTILHRGAAVPAAPLVVLAGWDYWNA